VPIAVGAEHANAVQPVQRPSPVLIALCISGVAAAAASCNALLGSSPPKPHPPDSDANASDADLSEAEPPDADGPVADVSDGGPPASDASEDDAAPACPPPVFCDSGCNGVIPRIAPPSDAGAPACDAGDGGQCGLSLLAGSPDTNYGLFALYGIAVVGDTVYGTDYYTRPYSAVFRASTTSYTPNPQGIFPAPHDGGVNGSAADKMITDGSRIYFASFQDFNSDLPGGVYSIDLQGNGGPIALMQGVECLALDSTHVYWGTPSGDFWRADRDGGNAVETKLPKWTNLRCVVKGGRLYYSAVLSGGLVAADPANPANVLARYSGPTQAHQFDVGSEYVFWADETNQAIYRAPVGCPGVVEDITPPGFTFARSWLTLRTDDQWVYVINSDIGPPGAGVISRFRIDGSSLEVMATMDDAVMGVDQDSTALYFGTYGQGQQKGPPYPAVWKLAK
jgi:hypothetical protein